jgi:hypothetical protein
MTKKDIKIIDDAIQYLCSKQDRIKIIRQTLGINTDFDFLKEVETIEYLFQSVLRERKNYKDCLITAGTSGWTVQYMRTNKTYKKGEKYNLHIFFSFVEVDTFK